MKLPSLRSILFLAALVLTSTLLAAEPFQLCSPEKLAALKASLPATEKDLWQDVFHNEHTLFYTEAEIPPAYQHADAGLIVNGFRVGMGEERRASTFHSPRYNISGEPNERAKGPGRGGNANIEFPWRTPGGVDRGEDRVKTFKLMLLPEKDGRRLPVVWYPKSWNDSRFGTHHGYGWIFPVGTIFGEILALQDSQGAVHTFEVRLRIREQTYWDVAILRPFPQAEQLEVTLAARGVSENTTAKIGGKGGMKLRKLHDALHPFSGFDAQAGLDPLPPLGEKLAAELLDSTPFKVATGAVWKEHGGVKASAPTSLEDFSIVPRDYNGTFLGTDNETCAKCHESTQKHVDVFDNRRDWYGRVRGSSDGIFTFHPIEPSSISYNGAPLAVRIRQAFVDAGIVERFDSEKHPKDLYCTFKE